MPWIIAGIFGCLFAAAASDAEDERNKRIREQQLFRSELAGLESRIAAMESYEAQLRQLLTDRDEKLRMCVLELQRLRARRSELYSQQS